jgi:hypothetical protein
MLNNVKPLEPTVTADVKHSPFHDQTKIKSHSKGTSVPINLVHHPNFQ